MGLAYFLAKNNVDVWGIDQSWTLVPAEVTDFSFMKDWDMQRQVQDLKKAMTLVRVIRFLGGSGLKPLNLLGYSSGSAVGFALINQETLDRPNNRNVAGFIPVDFGIATDDPVWEANNCDNATFLQGVFDSGQYHDVNPLPFFGNAALADPDGASALIEGFTNKQAALALGVYPLFENSPWHYAAGTFDDQQIPIGLQYTDYDEWIDFLIYSPPYEPIAFEIDVWSTNCSSAGDLPWDDHLSEIKNPILYVSAGGGFGERSTKTLSLLGSTDITDLTVSFYPESEVLLDYGHIDLFTAGNAEEHFWQPMLDWIKDH